MVPLSHDEHEGATQQDLQLGGGGGESATDLIQYESTMIFANSSQDAHLLGIALRGRGVPCEEFHGLVFQTDKLSALRRFRDGTLSILVCTDSAARYH